MQQSLLTTGGHTFSAAVLLLFKYPSSRPALVVCRSPDGYFHTFTADSDAFHVLATFDTEGVGSVSYAQAQGGKPWLVVTKEGWSLSTATGSISDKGKWPRYSKEPIILHVTAHLSIRFLNRQHVVAHFVCEDVDREFQCGEFSRRTEGSYLDKVVSKSVNGRLELDVGRIRERIDKVGSVFVERGPHHRVTQQPGLGNLKSMLDSIGRDSPIMAAISQLDISQARLNAIDTLPRPSYGAKGSRPPSRLEDFGSAPMTDAQQKLARSMERSRATQPKYRAKRQKLQLISVRELDDAVAGPGAPSDVLCAVCVLVDWNPVCCRLEQKELQAANHELQEAAEAASTSDAAHIQVYKLDGSECRVLQSRYNFRTAPMFLFFYQGQLVHAGNNIRSKAEFKDTAFGALSAARRGDFLQSDFKFGDCDNSLLDCITPHMSLVM